MRKLVVLALFVTLTIPSCTHRPVGYGRFTKYVDSFIAAGKRYGTKIDMNGQRIMFVDKFYGGLIGLCMPMFEPHQILVNEQWWNENDEDAREMVIWHELGHCVLGRPHKADMVNGHPVSIMYPNTKVLEDKEYYKSHKEQYTRELFR